MRERKIDYYALVLPNRLCMAGVRGDRRRPTAHHITIVRLDMPAAQAKALVQQQVTAVGALSHDSRADADTPLRMKVRALQPANASK